MSIWTSLWGPTQLDRVEALCIALNLKLKNGMEAVMSKLEEIKAAQAEAFAKLDAATNEVASDLKRLRDEVAAQIKPGLTEAEADEAKADLQAKADALVARLTDLAADPENPVPVEEPPTA